MTNVGGQIGMFMLLLRVTLTYALPRIHLRRLPLARLRRATLRHRVRRIRGFCVVLDWLRMGYSHDAYQGEQAVEGIYGPARQFVRILMLSTLGSSR